MCAKETAMGPKVSNISRPALRLIVRRDPRGNWWLIGTEGVFFALAVDAAGDLYVTDNSLTDYDRQRCPPPDGGSCEVGRIRIRKRDAQGRWSLIADVGQALGQ